MKKLMMLGVVLMLLNGCQMTISNTATEEAICDSWQGGLFLPSRSDTIETARGLAELGLRYDAACEG